MTYLEANVMASNHEIARTLTAIHAINIDNKLQLLSFFSMLEIYETLFQLILQHQWTINEIYLNEIMKYFSSEISVNFMHHLLQQLNSSSSSSSRIGSSDSGDITNDNEDICYTFDQEKVSRMVAHIIFYRHEVSNNNNNME
jgi:hypothetical protein